MKCLAQKRFHSKQTFESVYGTTYDMTEQKPSILKHKMNGLWNFSGLLYLDLWSRQLALFRESTSVHLQRHGRIGEVSESHPAWLGASQEDPAEKKRNVKKRKLYFSILSSNFFLQNEYVSWFGKKKRKEKMSSLGILAQKDIPRTGFEPVT